MQAESGIGRGDALVLRSMAAAQRTRARRHGLIVHGLCADSRGPAGLLWTTHGERVHEALEVVDVECWGSGGLVAVGVGVVGGELVQEALEVVDVEDRWCC